MLLKCLVFPIGGRLFFGQNIQLRLVTRVTQFQPGVCKSSTGWYHLCREGREHT